MALFWTFYMFDLGFIIMVFDYLTIDIRSNHESDKNSNLHLSVRMRASQYPLNVAV